MALQESGNHRFVSRQLFSEAAELFIISTILSLGLLITLALPVSAQSDTGSARRGGSLGEDARKSAEHVDAVSVPTPGEFFAAIDKIGKPEWSSMFRPPIPNTFSSRPQLALHIGGLIADGYVAVAAQDSQQVKNIGRDVINFAKALAVSEDLIARGNSIVEFADNFEWSALREELEATQNEVKIALTAQKDSFLITLVTLGGWIRAAEIASGVIAKSYTPDGARLLRQAALVAYLRSKLDSLPETMRKDPLVTEVATRLEALEKMIEFPADHVPTIEEVRAINSLARETVGMITGQPAEAPSARAAETDASPVAPATQDTASNP